MCCPLQQRAFIENYLSQKYCRPDAITRQAMTLALRPELPNAARLDTAAAPTACDRVWDSAGKAHDAYQTTDAKEPLLTTLGGQKSCNFDGVNDGYECSRLAWGGALIRLIRSWGCESDQPLTFRSSWLPMVAMRKRSPACCMNCSSGEVRAYRRERYLRWSIARKLGQYPGIQLLEWTHWGYRPCIEMGVLVGITGWSSLEPVGGQVTVGYLTSSSGQTLLEHLGDFLHRDVQLTGTALWEAREYLVAKYGLPWNAALVPDHVSILDPRVSDSVTTAGGAVCRVTASTR